MNNFKGLYGLFELVVTIVTMAWLALMDSLMLVEYQMTKTVDEKLLFSMCFVNVLGLFLIFLPLISIKLDKYNNEFIEFINFPKVGEKVTFPIITTFLGEQALGSFLGTALIFTTIESVKSFGVVLSSAYCVLFYIISIAIVCTSLARFVKYFTVNKWSYIIGSSISMLVTFSFYNLGLVLGHH